MPRGRPKIGNSAAYAQAPASSAPTTETGPAGGTLLGDIPLTNITSPSPSYSGWTSASGEAVEMEDAPPPWETETNGGRHNTDARRFVDVPDSWELRWISQRMLEHYGSRDWKPVKAHDRSNVKVRVKSPGMVSADGFIRRGGLGGDLLFYMPKHWVESRKRVKAAAVQKATAAAAEGMQSARERAMRTGYMRVDSAVHPTHTMGDGRSMEKD